MKKFGRYPKLSNADYHSDKDFISRSSVIDFLKSPYTFWAKHVNPNARGNKATPQMEFGTMFHTLILEPLEFAKNYAIEPHRVLLKDVGRELYDEYKRICADIEESGKIIVTQNDHDALVEMKTKIYSSEQAMRLIESESIEHSFFWQDKDSGVLLKARPDILHDNIIVDLKTCSDASPRAYQYEMQKYGYHIQAAMIRDAVETLEGRRINNVINICVERTWPHNMAIYIIDQEAIDQGEHVYKSILMDIKHAIAHNEWKDFGIQTVGLPAWAY